MPIIKSFPLSVITKVDQIQKDIDLMKKAAWGEDDVLDSLEDILPNGIAMTSMEELCTLEELLEDHATTKRMVS